MHVERTFAPGDVKRDHQLEEIRGVNVYESSRDDVVTTTGNDAVGGTDIDIEKRKE